MSKFTEGKWTADDYGEYVFAHGNDMMICQMRGWAYLKGKGLSGEEAIEVQEANARLIAAAPEMYEMLKTCSDHFHHIGFSPMGDMCDEIIARIDGQEQEGEA